MPLDPWTLHWVAKPVTNKEGLEILERDRYRCQYCGLDGMASFENAMAMSVDFVVPRARKGRKDPRNLVACCRSCNIIKGTRNYRNFDEAKAYVLRHREALRKAWAARVSQPRGKAAAASTPATELQAPTSAHAHGKAKAATASVISGSPLSIRGA